MQLWKKPILSRSEQARQVARSARVGRIINAQDATLQLDPEVHGDRIVCLDRAGGIAVTLPPSTGDGTRFTLIVKTTFSSNATIKVQNATDVFRGMVFQLADAGTTLAAYEAASTDDTLTLTGTTSGGVAGDRYEFTDYAPGFWSLMAWTAATGAEASPLSATVS